VSRARSRPPRLELRVGSAQVAPPPTLLDLIERSKVAGPGGAGLGPTELRRKVERLAIGDRHELGELSPINGLTVNAAWTAVNETYGASFESALIDAARTASAVRAAAARVRAVASTGGRVAIATSRPASLLTLDLAFAALVRDNEGELIDLVDFGPIRADGRASRWLRWVGGVAVVTDGRTLCATADGEAAREWLFAMPRPALVVADGPFAEVAWEAGIDVVAFAGLDRPALAVVAHRDGSDIVVPLRTDRPTRAYRVLEDLVAGRSVASAPEV
jgi:histidinol phosphate phosphatase hisN-like protein